MCVEGLRYECPATKVCPLERMEDSLTCTDGYAEADMDTAPSALGVANSGGSPGAVRCECKRNFYGYATREGKSVRLAGLSDMETLDIQCQPCFEGGICNAAGIEFHTLTFEATYWQEKEFFDHRPHMLYMESCKHIRMMGAACAAGDWNATCLHGFSGPM